jgi:DNA-binding MarR family transcriptional regulator
MTELQQTSPEIVRTLNAVRSIVRALRLLSRAIEVQTGMSLAQLYVLEQLSESPVESLQELADKTATHQSSVSVVVRRLESRGFLTRTTAPGDRRRVLIAVTDEGRAALQAAPQTLHKQLVAGLETLSVEDRAQLADLMERWMQGAKIDLLGPFAFNEDAPV